MLSTVEERVVKLEESMVDINDLVNVVSGRIDDWERNDALEATVMALKEEIMAMKKALSTRIEEL
ncbi:hypothetical protein J1N35_037410 [Gossypium stocksii]|uniref:Uncharacterized protein n=1 Tax=Gossypium stocksii TaxID=47602 RepID=A0A9D3UJL5_9ROSI|nr:hypothetical protein J1N35_037410 [Gossypium stocksii]